jgi:phospholipid-binding lipoprotein MlaA
MYPTFKNKSVLKIVCLTLLLLSGCATTGTTGKISEIDPYEDFNRSVFSFNKTFDDYVTSPIATAYDWITPSFVQTGIGNFFSNLKDINVVLNDVLQGKFEQSGEDFGRFLFNTTFGVAGLFDAASHIGLQKHEEDFDQTFATWGIPQGPYLVLPILGPTTGRGIGGTVLDTATNPASYIEAPIQFLDLLNQRVNADTALKTVYDALDPYIFLREAYLQKRKNLINDGKFDPEDDVLNLDDSFSSSTKPSADKVNDKMQLGTENQSSSKTTP